MTKQQLINYLSKMRTMAEDTSDVRIHIGTVIDMNTNKPNIVIHVKEK